VDSLLLDILLRASPLLGLLLLGYAAGRYLELRHFANIQEREKRLETLPAITLRQTPEGWNPLESGLVTGSVVVSVDFFKRAVSRLRMLFGGQLRSYAPLLERGRREAILRMKEEAAAAGFDAVVNVRFETSRLANADGRTTAGVEMLAYGTGLRLDRPPVSSGGSLSQYQH
jgi:uncharacterized protein YbjQ (UPF0145 family)